MQSGYTSAQSGFTLLSELSDSDLDWFFSAGKRERPAPQTVIVKEGGEGEFIYFVLEGLLGVYSASVGGREIARLGPGQIFGEMSFLEDRPASATVKTLEESHLLAIRRGDLEAKLAADFALARAPLQIPGHHFGAASARDDGHVVPLDGSRRSPASGCRRAPALAGDRGEDAGLQGTHRQGGQGGYRSRRTKLSSGWKQDWLPYCEFMNAAIGEELAGIGQRPRGTGLRGFSARCCLISSNRRRWRASIESRAATRRISPRWGGSSKTNLGARAASALFWIRRFCGFP